MKIAVVCANGKAGQLIVKEAVNRGFDITAVVKGENKSAAQNVIVKDLFDLTAADLTKTPHRSPQNHAWSNIWAPCDLVS